MLVYAGERTVGNSSLNDSGARNNPINNQVLNKKDVWLESSSKLEFCSLNRFCCRTKKGQEFIYGKKQVTRGVVFVKEVGWFNGKRSLAWDASAFDWLYFAGLSEIINSIEFINFAAATPSSINFRINFLEKSVTCRRRSYVFLWADSIEKGRPDSGEFFDREQERKIEIMSVFVRIYAVSWQPSSWNVLDIALCQPPLRAVEGLQFSKIDVILIVSR
jgi:hypothetical protein